MPTSVKIVDCSMAHVPSVQKRAPPRKHEFQLSSHFWDFISIWVSLYSFYLFYLIHNSKGHKCSGLFCTKLQVLWFLTLVILLVKHVNLLIWLKFIYKAALNSSIDTHISPFCCIFRALWLVTSLGHRGTHTPWNYTHGIVGACAHGEVTTHLFGSFISYLNSCNHKFSLFLVILHIFQFVSHSK